MATLLLWASDENGSGGNTSVNGNGNSERRNSKEVLQFQSSSKACEKVPAKKVKINGGAQRKQPQRGLGVAQLERLRLQEQKKRLQEDTALVAGSRMAQPQQPYVTPPYGYARHGHGVYGPFSLVDIRHPHARHMSACPLLRPVPGSNPAGAQLPFLHKYGLQEGQPFVTNGNFAGVEEDNRLRGLPQNIYPFGRKETEAAFLKPPCNFVMDSQFAETSEMMPHCGPFLPSFAASKVGVPFTVDQPKELSSFQNFYDNSNWFDPAGTKDHPWYTMQQRQKHAHNFTAALDLKLSAGEGEGNVNPDIRDRPGFRSLVRGSSNSLRSDTRAVFHQESIKSSGYGSCRDAIMTSRKNNPNQSRKRQRREEGGGQGADFLALKLTTSPRETHSNNADDKICDIHGSISSAIKEHPANTAEEKAEAVHTHMFLPTFEKDELVMNEEYPPLLEISSNSASGASTDAGSVACHSPTPLDLSLKLAI